jgi:hypothetical protein
LTLLDKDDIKKKQKKNIEIIMQREAVHAKSSQEVNSFEKEKSNKPT